MNGISDVLFAHKKIKGEDATTDDLFDYIRFMNELNAKRSH